jgi:hypothetical protein
VTVVDPHHNLVQHRAHDPLAGGSGSGRVIPGLLEISAKTHQRRTLVVA